MENQTCNKLQSRNQVSQLMEEHIKNLPIGGELTLYDFEHYIGKYCTTRTYIGQLLSLQCAKGVLKISRKEMVGKHLISIYTKCGAKDKIVDGGLALQKSWTGVNRD